MPKVVRLELRAKDAKRAVGFYRDVFGWKIDRFGGPFSGWMTSSSPNDLPDVIGMMFKIDPSAALAIDVSSIDR